MKKIVLIITFFAFLTYVKAQDLRNLRIGLVFSNAVLFNSSDNAKIKNVVSYDFDYGISFDYFFTENYALSTGVYMDNPFFVREGGFKAVLGENDSTYLASDFAIKNGITAVTINNREKITGMHINIPLSFKLKTNEIGYFKYFGDINCMMPNTQFSTNIFSLCHSGRTVINTKFRNKHRHGKAFYCIPFFP